jgi:hypothetical protein
LLSSATGFLAFWFDRLLPGSSVEIYSPAIKSKSNC